MFVDMYVTNNVIALLHAVNISWIESLHTLPEMYFSDWLALSLASSLLASAAGTCCQQKMKFKHQLHTVSQY